MELTKFDSEAKFSSLYLVEQINMFRGVDLNNPSLLAHHTLLAKIEKEFDEEIIDKKILVNEYKDSRGRKLKMYELTYEQSVQILMSESKIVRRQVIEVLKKQQSKIEALESKQPLHPSLPTDFIESLEMLLESKKKEKQLSFELEIKTQDLVLANETIKEQAPSVAFVEKVLQSKTTYTSNQVALGVGMTAQKLNTVLQNKGILYKQSGSWHLYGNYRNKGYAETRTHQYFNSKNEPMTSTQLVWTEAGRKFIHEQLNSNLNYAVVQTQTSTTA